MGEVQYQLKSESNQRGLVIAYTIFDGKIRAGRLMVTKCEDRSIYIWRMKVKELYRRRGLATWLLQAMLEDFKDRVIRLNVLETNTIAQNLYFKLGFIHTPDYDRGDQWEMELLPRVA